MPALEIQPTEDRVLIEHVSDEQRAAIAGEVELEEPEDETMPEEGGTPAVITQPAPAAPDDDYDEGPRIGIVLATGPDVSGLNVGDLVLLDRWAGSDIELAGRELCFVRVDSVLATIKPTT